MTKYLFNGAPSAGQILVEGKGCEEKDTNGKGYKDCGSQDFVPDTGSLNEDAIEAVFREARMLSLVQIAHDTIPRLLSGI